MYSIPSTSHHLHHNHTSPRQHHLSCGLPQQASWDFFLFLLLSFIVCSLHSSHLKSVKPCNFFNFIPCNFNSSFIPISFQIKSEVSVIVLFVYDLAHLSLGLSSYHSGPCSLASSYSYILDTTQRCQASFFPGFAFAISSAWGDSFITLFHTSIYVSRRRPRTTPSLK